MLPVTRSIRSSRRRSRSSAARIALSSRALLTVEPGAVGTDVVVAGGLVAGRGWDDLEAALGAGVPTGARSCAAASDAVRVSAAARPRTMRIIKSPRGTQPGQRGRRVARLPAPLHRVDLPTEIG